MDRPTVNGILEAALYVKAPARSAKFYRRHFGFEIGEVLDLLEG